MGVLKKRSDDIVVSTSGKVLYSIKDGVKYYPYRWNDIYFGWNFVSGYYSLRYFKRLLRENRAKWA
ncbi:MAG: hypothetical protein IJI14_14820 [Anaerolineaceae bacterium]|nr:hypothetical protein [Anaerolineaceae bacterium]